MSAVARTLVTGKPIGRPIGVLGGTFDPIHNGHLRVAVEAFEALDLDHVRLVPLHQPGHRAGPHASTAQRLAMIARCARTPLVLDDREIVRGGTSYTVDTLTELRAEFPERSLCLLIGRDAYLSLPRWERPEELLHLAHIVVAARPQVVANAHDPALDALTAHAHVHDVAALHARRAGCVYFLEIPLLPISSSDLRVRRRDGRDVRHLVPDPVHDYINEEQLYRT